MSFVARNGSLHVVQGCAGARDECHVAGLVVDDAGQGRGREDGVAARGCRTPVELRAATAHQECEPITGGRCEQRCHFGRIARREHRRTVFVGQPIGAEDACEIGHYIRSPSPAASTRCV